MSYLFFTYQKIFPKKKCRKIALSSSGVPNSTFLHLKEVFDGGAIGPGGGTLENFERKLMAITGFRHAVATVSCSAALHLAFRIAGVGPGDEVWCPTLTFIASLAPAIELGGIPRLLDVSPDTWTLDPQLLAEELNVAARRGRVPKAVVATDLFGYPADIDAIAEACAGFDVFLICDSAASLGSFIRDRHAGTGAHIACISFNRNKIVTTGGGGALLTNDAYIAKFARKLAAQAREPVLYYEHRTLGYTYGLSNIAAAIGIAQISELKERIRRRKENFKYYYSVFSELGGFFSQSAFPWIDANRWLSCFWLDKRWRGVDLIKVCESAHEEGIDIRPVWRPLHSQPLLSGAPRVGGQIAEAISAHGICLPSGCDLLDADRERVVTFLLDRLKAL